MALLLVEGFDDVATSVGADVTTPLGRRYSCYGSSTWTIVSAAPRFSGYALGGTGACYLHTEWPLTTNDTLIVGLAFYTKKETTTSTGAVNVLYLYDGATNGVNVRVMTQTGEVTVYCNTTLLGTSRAGVVVYGNWYYLEVKVKCHSSAGTVEVRVGNETVISVSGINTQGGSHTYHDTLRLSPGDYYSYDDLYVCDSSGSVNNDFLGNRIVTTIFPTADAGTNEWTPSAVADHYTLVDEGVENSDTDYVSGTSGQSELWGYGNIAGTGAVNGIMVTTVCRDTTTVLHSLKTLVKSGETVSEDTAQVIGNNDYGVRRRVIELDPNLSPAGAWTQTTVNAAQFGVKVA